MPTPDPPDLDITRLMRSRRLCIFASWPLYIAASFSLLLVLAGIQWLVVPAVLIALGFASGRGSLSAGLLQTILVVAFAIWLFSIASPEERRDPFLLAIGLVVVLTSLVGLSAAVVYRSRLPPKSGILRSRRARALLASVPIRRVAASAGSFLLGVALLLPLPLVITAGLVLDTGLEDLVARIEAPTWQWVVLGVPAGLALFALFVLSLGAASWLITRAKRLATPAAGEARRQDPRRPVLLLRSFADDQTPVDRAPTLNRTFSDYYSTARTVEDVIEKELRVYGPVIAVGRPGESLPPAGAAREYLADEEWKPRVRELMAEARLVVVVLGQTEGLRYEYRALIEERAIERTVLVFPPQSGEDVIVRWAAAARGIGIGGERPTLPSPERTLSAVLVDRLEPRFVTCRWRDDESYRHALRWSAAILEDVEAGR